MVLLDSNIVIYGLQPGYQYLRDELEGRNLAVSKITIIEVLGYHGLDSREFKDITKVLEALRQLTITDSVIHEAIRLRQVKKMSLADSIIAATAIVHDAVLYTANVKDFNWIKELQTYNPIR